MPIRARQHLERHSIEYVRINMVYPKRPTRQQEWGGTRIARGIVGPIPAANVDIDSIVQNIGASGDTDLLGWFENHARPNNVLPRPVPRGEEVGLNPRTAEAGSR